jgi:hypothetical protein
MIFPPALFRLRLVEYGRKKVGLWVPVFLLWPLLLVLAAVSVPLLLVAALALWRNPKARKALKSIPAAFVAFCSLRGCRIEVNGAEEEVFIKIT